MMKSLFLKIDNYCKLAQQTAFPFAEDKIEPVKSVVPSVLPPVPSTPPPVPQVTQPVPHVQTPIVEKCDAPGCQQPASDWYNDPDNEGNHFCRAHLRECSNCDTWVYVGEMMKDPTTPTGTNLYCEDCYRNIFTVCPNCDKTVNKENILMQPRDVRYIYNISLKNGGCTDCAVQCYQCSKVIDKDSAIIEDREPWCEDCYNKEFTTCDGCGNSTNIDSVTYVDEESYCNHCFATNFVMCEGCREPVRITESVNIDDNDYCEECAKAFKPEKHYKPYMENFDEFSYTKKDRFLNQIYKLLPISVKELKAKHQQIANGLNDLIVFAKGKDITTEIVKAYRATLDPEEFTVDYSAWHSSLQRSVKRDEPQLVINIISSREMNEKFNSNPVLADLFKRINYLSEQSGHPMVEDQIGWVRVEIDPNNEYLLVDEIQSDHSNGSYRLKNDIGSYDVIQVRDALKRKYKLDNESFDKVLQQYNDILKDFPNIAAQAITKFAQQNKIKKIYWHTYESGKALKTGNPPRSLYDKTPRENFFAPTEEKPFGLQGDFFGKEAKRVDRMMRLAKKLHLTYFVK